DIQHARIAWQLAMLALHVAVMNKDVEERLPSPIRGRAYAFILGQQKLPAPIAAANDAHELLRLRTAAGFAREVGRLAAVPPPRFAGAFVGATGPPLSPVVRGAAPFPRVGLCGRWPLPRGSAGSSSSNLATPI